MKDRIKLLVNANRTGLIVSKLHFDLLSDLILKVVNKHEEITLTQLISLPPIDLPGFTGDYTWCLLQVKRHLEVMGIIKTEILRLRIQIIKKVKKSPRRFAIYG